MLVIIKLFENMNMDDDDIDCYFNSDDRNHNNI
jgi:hypothetical protein